MKDMSCVFPRDYDRHVERKYFSSEIVNRRGVLEKFLIDIGDYTGPFQKTMFLQTSWFRKKLKEVGVDVRKSKMNGRWYFNTEQSVDPVLFDPELLDAPKEEQTK